MVSKFIERHSPWLLWVLAIPAMQHLRWLGRVLAVRLRYPGNIEWMEGGALYHSYRLLHGQPLYTPPGEGFMPYPYPPVHATLLATLGGIFGLNHTTARALSLGAVLVFATAASIHLYQHLKSSVSAHPNGHRFLLTLPWVLLLWGTVSVGYPLCAGWYDIIRPDSLAMGMVGIATLVIAHLRSRDDEYDAWPFSWRGIRHWPGSVRGQWPLLFGAAAALSATVLTKQTNVFPVAWLLLFLFSRAPLRAVFVGAIAALGTLAIVLALNTTSNGNYLFYTVELLSHHAVIYTAFPTAKRLVLEFAPYLPWLPLAVLALALHGHLSHRTLLWFGLLVAMIPASILPYMKQGGFDNNFLPIAVLAGPTLLFVIGDAIRAGGQTERARHALVLFFGASVATYLFFRPSNYGPKPTPQHFENVREIDAFMRELGPRTMALSAPFLAVRNGAEIEQIHGMPWKDAKWAKVPGLDATRYLKTQNPEYILVGNVDEISVRCAIDRHYVSNAKHPPSHGITLMGSRRFTQLMVKRNDERAKERNVFDFETGNLPGWNATGDAFALPLSKTEGRENQSFIPCGQGAYLVNSFHPTLADAAQGRLVSPSFAIDRDFMALLVGGGGKTRVELHVDGNVARVAYGNRSESMGLRVWTVKDLRGRQATLHVIDEDSGAWGHILLDDVRLFDRP